MQEADAGVAVKDLCRRHGFSEASYYLWRSKYGDLDVSEAKRLRALETENARLKKLLEQEITREALRLIEPGKPNQNAYIESFNGRLRDECLNEHWLLNLVHARAVIEAWRREYNEERLKKALGGLTPVEYARQLAAKSATVTTGL